MARSWPTIDIVEKRFTETTSLREAKSSSRRLRGKDESVCLKKALEIETQFEFKEFKPSLRNSNEEIR